MASSPPGGSCTTSTSSTVLQIVSLPETLLGEILEWLDLANRRQLMVTCSTLWSLRSSLEQQCLTLRLTSRTDLKIFATTNNWKNLLHLDFGNLCCDSILSSSSLGSMSSLQKISMISSLKVTDFGLAALAAIFGEEDGQQLSEVDITFCRNTTYMGTFPIRDRFPNILIRRQPDWMTGRECVCI